MKTTLLILIIALSNTSLFSQNIDWHYVPDGVSSDWGGWEYKDILIPNGMKIDSVYGAFTRPGYTNDAHDYIFSYNTGLVYDATSATSPWVYANENTSLYNKWINLTSFNYIGDGVVRIGLPTNAGAIWDSLGIAYTSTVGMNELTNSSAKTFPNPAQDKISFESNTNGKVKIYNLMGDMIFSVTKSEKQIYLNVSSFLPGVYFIREENGNTIKFIKQ